MRLPQVRMHLLGPWSRTHCAPPHLLASWPSSVKARVRREKSATREATAVLGEYLRIVAPGPVPAAALETGQPCAPALGEERPAAAPRPQPTPLLALVKLACKGAVCLRLLGPGSPGEAVERLVRDVEQGKRPQLQCVAPLLRQEGRGVSCATSERAA